MLHFLYDKAIGGGYKGVILIADRNTPAFDLYLKEGLMVSLDALPF